MTDEITRKHLQRARVRGAPATIPGVAGLVGDYESQQLIRQTLRALALPLERNFRVEALREGQQKLSQVAAAQQLRVLEAPLFALHGDPVEDLPHEWSWQLLLPVRGRAQAIEADGITVERVHGGQYVETLTKKGFPDLLNLYTFFLGHYLPRSKHQLTRPCIYHRVVSGLESDDPAKLTLAVFMPIQLSLKAPVRLVTREEM